MGYVTNRHHGALRMNKLIVIQPDELSEMLTRAVHDAVIAALSKKTLQEKGSPLLSQKEMLRPFEVEQLFGITIETLTKLRNKGQGPRYTQFKSGGAIYYATDDVRAFISEHKVKTYDQA